MIPPQGFRHAVDLLLKNGARTVPFDAERLSRALVALGDDMHAPPEFAAWVVAEYERVLRQPAPTVLAQLGRRSSPEPDRRDVFLIYVPEDRLPIAAPLAVELAKRRVGVAFSEYEVESEGQLASALARGLSLNRAGLVLVTADFRRRTLPEPAPGPRLKILVQATNPAAQADGLAAWLSTIPPDPAGSS